MEFPEKFMDRMRALLGREYPDFEAAMHRGAVRALRVNGAETTPETLIALPASSELSLRPVGFTHDGFFFDHDGIGHHPYHHAGAFYVQDPGAMSAAYATPAAPGMRVLDLCAAPGGKTSRLSDAVGESGFVVSNETVRQRCRTLAGNCERLGLRNTAVTNMSPDDAAALFPGYFDLTLADVPCSGEGMFRKSEEAVSCWSPENVAMCAERSSGIIRRAAETVKPGGYLVYSTCTWSTEENEEVIRDFLASEPQFSLCDAPEEIKHITADGIEISGCGEGIKKCRRFYPHLYDGEGQFFAIMKRSVDNYAAFPAYRDSFRQLSRDERATVRDFILSVIEDRDKAEELIERVRGFGENSVIPPQGFSCPPHGVYSAGVTVGRASRGVLTPHHSFFKAYGTRFRSKVGLETGSEPLTKYLRGETIPTSVPDGWCAVLVDGLPLGGGKAVSGTLKNHYPKGLREP